MTAAASTITVIEDFRDKDGGPVFTSRPDFQQPVYPTHAEFIYRASRALSEFRKDWRARHPEDPFARGIELDVAPVMTEGSIMGYMVLSEIDGETYNYVPAQQVEEQPVDPNPLDGRGEE